MPNILDYIEWRGDLSFEVSPLNEVDNLIFAKLSYLDFKSIYDDEKLNTLEELAKAYIDKNGFEKIGMFLDEKFPKLLQAVGSSERFKEVVVGDIVDNTNQEKVIQFAAMTFSLPDNQRFIAYRGTDDSIVGWKEDFLMTILDTIPAQEEALRYLENIAEKYPHEEFYIGGHSKGGNLSVYSGVNASDSVKERCLKIFNNDGPGFKESIIDSQSYKAVAHKIKTLVPKSSIVGMLLENEESYEVVQCSIKQSGLLQHDGFTWEVKGRSFVHLQEVDRESRIVDRTLKKVLNDLTLEQREQFIHAFFDILSANNQKQLMDIEEGQFMSLFAMRKVYSGLDKQTKRALYEVWGAIVGEGFKQIFAKETIPS